MSKSAPPDYEVGYGKPPKKHRFRTGASGNPKGRPRGSGKKNSTDLEQKLVDIVEKEASRLVTIQTETGPEQIQMNEAVIRSIYVNAAKGDHRAQKTVIELNRLISSHKADEDTPEERHPIVLWGGRGKANPL
jgi:hypothetical protein